MVPVPLDGFGDALAEVVGGGVAEEVAGFFDGGQRVFDVARPFGSVAGLDGGNRWIVGAEQSAELAEEGVEVGVAAAGDVVNLIEGLGLLREQAALVGLDDVVDELKVRMGEHMRQVPGLAGGEVIEHDHPVVLRQQRVNQIRSDKPSTTGDEDTAICYGSLHMRLLKIISR